MLEAESDAFYDDSPIHDDLAPFTVRCRVKPIVTLEPEWAIPIYDDNLWNALSITNQYEKRHRFWTGFFRSSLNRFEEDDGRYLVELLKKQLSNPETYPLTDKDRRQLTGRRKIRALDREVEVEIPDIDDEVDPLGLTKPGSLTVLTVGDLVKNEILIQARIAQVGAQMGFRIWVPRSDKARVLEHIPPGGMAAEFLDELPLNYDDTTIRTVEQD